MKKLKFLSKISNIAFVETNQDVQDNIETLNYNIREEKLQLCLEVLSKTTVGLLGFGSALCNKKQRKLILDTFILVPKSFDKSQFIDKPTLLNVLKVCVNNASNTFDVIFSKSLDQFSDKELQEYMVNCLELTCNITGYSLQEILNLRFENNLTYSHYESSFEGENQDKSVKPYFESFHYDTKSIDYLEATTPSLTNRISIALNNYVLGKSPNKFRLNITDVPSLFKSIKDDCIKAQAQVIKELTDNSVSKKESIINENGDVLPTK